MMSTFAFQLTCLLVIVTTDARSIKRSADCPSAYSDISATHTRCLEDVGEIVALSESQKQAAVDKHNRIRAEVTPAAADMQKVVWDDDMAEVAAKWAAQCVMDHDTYVDRSMPELTGVLIGQNVAAWDEDLSAAIERWAQEVSHFSYGDAPTGGVLHYTQIVLNSTAHIGCGVARCPNYGQFYVCNYAAGQMSWAQSTPFTAGSESCSGCSDFCDDTGTLCDCGGKVCQNGGELNLETCSCECPSLYAGELCDVVNCRSDAPYCLYYLQRFGQDFCTRYTNIPIECPFMCGLC